MKRSILKGIFFGIILFAALILFEFIMNKGNTDMTMEMAPATYPLAYMEVEGEQVNCMRGYREDMDVAYMRDSLTPISEDRKVGITLDKYGRTIGKISFQIRNIDGSRLVEDTEITEFEETKDTITATVIIKDLIEQNAEYNFILKVVTDGGEELSFYTRIIYGTDMYVSEKLEFVKNFSTLTFNKEKAAEELVQYLESDSTGDNSTFGKVTIHSNLNQITWGDLQVEKTSAENLYIKEMMKETASIQNRYIVSSVDGKETTYYNVTEYYRIRYTNDRIYLLDFTREMKQIFDAEKNNYAANKIALGIQNTDDISIMESDGGGIFAFVVNGRLYAYNIADKKMALLFSFFDNENIDARTLYQNFDIKILNVDEAGNVQFVVSGYMNRGHHEGQVGIQVNYFNSSQNTIEEQTFIPSFKSPEILKYESSNLSYVSNSNKYYFMLDNAAYELSLDDGNYKVVAFGLDENSYSVSDSDSMMVWIVGENEYSASQLILKNLTSGGQKTIEAEQDDYIRPLGFIGDDLIYGLAKKADVKQESSGRMNYPIYQVVILSSNGKVLKEYHTPGIYVTDCEVRENQINLHRVQYNQETGLYTEVEDDQIMNSQSQSDGKNTIETIPIDVKETITQISVKKEISLSGMKFLTPKEVIYEGQHDVHMEESESSDRFYVYTMYGLDGIYSEEANAVGIAENAAGVVLHNTGGYVWYRGNRVTRNQIMKIQGTQSDETKSTLAVCLDTILSFEGVSRSSQYMLDSGKTVVDILQDNIKDIVVLNLTGCSLDSTLYYVNQDLPVLATLNDGNAVLVIGFNELNVVLMNPESGTVYKMGMNDATEWFAENGNAFITYIRAE